MNQISKDQRDVYVVQCVWCGASIREDNEEEATGVCLKCFYQILSNHLQSQKQAQYGEFVSDR
jgi:hypothetical protein